jgi:pilus assembly protein Flp/PilA
MPFLCPSGTECSFNLSFGVDHFVNHIIIHLFMGEGFMKKLIRSEKGQGLVEYALILVLVAIVVLAVLLLLGPTVGNAFSNIVANLQRFSGGGSGPITGVAPSRSGNDVSVIVTVSSTTDITIGVSSGTILGSNTQSCTVSCTFYIQNVNPGQGSVTASGGGGTKTASF